jgi:hypothetical protein
MRPLTESNGNAPNTTMDLPDYYHIILSLAHLGNNN